jgi:hypothetical protein
MACHNRAVLMFAHLNGDTVVTVLKDFSAPSG